MEVKAWSYKQNSLALGLAFLMRSNAQRPLLGALRAFERPLFRGFEPSAPVAREVGLYCGKVNWGDRRGSQKFCGIPMVRIHLPPAESQSLAGLCSRGSRTRLSAP